MDAGPPTHPTTDPYAGIAAWYDLEHDGFTADIEALNALLAGARERLAILEVGAGSGRLVAALAAAGHTVTGVEPSDAMRARAAKRLAALPERVTRRTRMVAGTATAPGLPGGERYDVALLGLGTYGHLTTPDERDSALRALHSALKPGAMLVLDVDLAGPRRLLETAGQLWWQGSWPAAGSGGVTISHMVTGSPGREPGTVEVTHLYDALEQDGALRRTLAVTMLAVLSRGEVELAARHAGFSDIAIYGGYDLTPADDQSPRALLTAHR